MPPASSPVPPEALLRHAGFLRSLACGLARDPGLRDDAVQDAWVAAMEHPPRDETKVKGWLATVLRNAVRKHRRSERRRASREQRRARPERTVSVVDQAARDELLRGVVAALFGLPSAQREVVMLRFYEGLPPREIAARTGVTVNTVKSRLRRALGALRAELDEVTGPRWRPALLSLTGIERLGPAAEVGAATSMGGAILVTTKLKLAIAVVILGALSIVGWNEWTPTNESGTSSLDRDPARVAREAEPRPGLDARPGATPDETPARSPDDPPTHEAVKRFIEGPSVATRRALGLLKMAPPGLIEGAFFVGEKTSSDAEAFVWDASGAGTAAGVPAGREPLGRVLVGSGGRFRFDHLAPGSYFVGIKVPGQPARLAWKSLALGAEPTEKAIIVFGTATVSGQVYDAAGIPAVDVTVRISNLGMGAWETIADMRTDVHGRYAFEGLLEGGGWLTVAFTNDFDDPQRTRSRRYFTKRGEHKTEDFGSPNGTPLVRGTARARNGEPLRGPGRMILQGSEQYVDITYQSDGRFAHRVPPGVYDAHVWLRDLYGHRTLTLDGAFTVGDRDLLQDIEIPGSRLHGEVARAERSGERARIGCVRDDVWIWVPISRDGTYVIDGLEPGTYEVRIGDDTERVTLVEGQTEARLDLAFPPK